MRRIGGDRKGVRGVSRSERGTHWGEGLREVKISERGRGDLRGSEGGGEGSDGTEVLVQCWPLHLWHPPKALRPSPLQSSLTGQVTLAYTNSNTLSNNCTYGHI